MSDADLDQLLNEAMRQARLRKPANRTKDETHIDYAKRLAEKGLYRRLSREAHARMDALRFEWWFSRQPNLTLDQWRVFIDNQIERSTRRSEIQEVAGAKAKGEVEGLDQVNPPAGASA